MAKIPEPEVDPKPDPADDSAQEQELESLADTEGELQDFMGSDETAPEKRLDLSDD
jgi:hypothetical protein